MSENLYYGDIQKGQPLSADTPLQGNEKKSADRGNCCIGTLLFLNTIILCVVFGFAVSAYDDIDKKTEPIVNLIEVFTAPEPDPKMVKSLSAILRDTLSNVFFFGSATGTVPNFLTHLLATDFGSLATAANSFGTQVMNAFENNLTPQSCQGPTITCPGYGNYKCPNGIDVYCYYQGMQASCQPASCININVVTAASWVVSISDLLKGWHQIQPAGGAAGSSSTAGSTAAFSDGIFRLNDVLTWLQAQMNYGDWKSAAANCAQVSSQIKSINWNGTYISPQGRFEHWDGNQGVVQALAYVDQICGTFNQLEKHSKKQHSTAATGHVVGHSTNNNNNNQKQAKPHSHRIRRH